jgi:hypothetical protein
MRKFIALFLVLSLATINCATFRTRGGKREKPGAKLIVTKKDFQQVEGELITVKPNSLLLLNTEGKDVSVDIADINIIKIVNKSKFWAGAGIGFLTGAGVGAIVGLVADKVIDLEDYIWGPKDSALLGGGIGGLLGALVGAKIGSDSKTIQIEGMNDSEIKEALDKLRKKARIRDYK